MVLLTKAIADFLGCPIKSLREEMHLPENQYRIIEKFKGQKVRTNYKSKDGEQKLMIIDGFTRNGADRMPAYGRLAKPYNISVAAHFYARHRIRLRYPFIPCVIQHFDKGENRYYPLELMELLDYDDEELAPINSRCESLYNGWRRESHPDKIVFSGTERPSSSISCTTTITLPAEGSECIDDLCPDCQIDWKIKHQDQCEACRQELNDIGIQW